MSLLMCYRCEVFPSPCHCVVFPSLVIASTTKWCVAICGALWFVIARPHQGPKQSLFWVSTICLGHGDCHVAQKCGLLAMTVREQRGIGMTDGRGVRPRNGVVEKGALLGVVIASTTKWCVAISLVAPYLENFIRK